MTKLEAETLATKDNSYFIELHKALLRLESNPDFQKVILDGFLKQKALDSVSLLARPDVKKRGERSEIMEDLIAISNFSYYLDMVHILGESKEYDEEDSLND
ncbi:hypothetical protein [Campylobacter hyointestinalis]|uniref:hypothetical protein n=1 Tax=Campylobacter hyointestinalis TaxID=198 RepID=UPI000728A077|nr:hypothetical protein [Campylobacter hyointestinalis]PPB52923.1 hypothetical protein CDQ67_09300 [Campylobacter hyointestinalis subsp. hyointestinalis]CUU90637.1 Uncharacterised protein [Campylobacter hyointestinalis subsp. hyointestinalis]